MELESIAAVIVGGTLLTGGRGTILGTVLGAFFFTAVRSQMIALGAPPSWYVAFVGIALLVVVTIKTLLARRLKPPKCLSAHSCYKIMLALQKPYRKAIC
jgi:ribose/xylose/arabinose/galactoside ABC-type transport system permease subunit